MLDRVRKLAPEPTQLGYIYLFWLGYVIENTFFVSLINWRFRVAFRTSGSTDVNGITEVSVRVNKETTTKNKRADDTVSQKEECT